MKKTVFFIYILLIVSPGIYAQHLKGIITNNEGEPVRYATVYIDELKLGTTANIKGEYDIKLKPGTYTVFYQSLGFSPEIKSIKIAGTDKVMDIQLTIQYYQIPEVRVTATGEDPAYGIMRKAIGMAPYHLNRVKKYEAEVYIKGSVVVNKIPRIMQRNINANNIDIEIKEGDSYLIESLNKIEYEAPETYRQTVIAQQSTFPETQQTDISPMDVVKASFYQPVLAEIAISPLSPNAMAHYRFSYEGSTPQGRYIINKIKVIPKRKSQQVFEGFIYIIEDLWCIHSLDLINENLAGSIEIKQVYTPVQNDIWMPVSHNFDVKVSIVGVDADGNYTSSVTYNSVEPNNDLPEPQMLSLNPTAEENILEEQRETSKTQSKIEEILQKDELSNRDMSRLSRLMEKEAEESDPSRNELQVEERSSYVVNDGADRKSQDFWAEVRPIPLSEDERKSIRLSDSLRVQSGLREPLNRTDSTDTGSQTSTNKGFGKTLGNIFFGETWYGENDSRFSYGGLLNFDYLGFNSVDGFEYGIDFNYRKAWDSGITMNLGPVIGWDFAKEKIDLRLNGNIFMNDMHFTRILFWMGMGSRDFTNSAGVSPFINMATSLLMKDNYMRLYDSRYITISQRREYFNGFYIELKYAFDDRKLLGNNTNFSFFRRDEVYSPNIPANDYIGAAGDTDADFLITDHVHHQFSTVISYIPMQRYRINNGTKTLAGTDYPTFKIYYDHGINITPDNEVHHFDHMQFEVNKNRDIGAFSEYLWRIRIGGFLSNEKLQFHDFYHFNTQPLPLHLRNYVDAFFLRDFYTLATPEYYIEAHMRYTTPYLLIKLLPFLSNSLMRENISLAYMYTPGNRNYYELGYTLSEVFLIGKLGVFVGFENLEYRSTGIKISLILN